MIPKLTLYSRRDCCLCVEMKTVISQVAETIALALTEVDIDGSVELEEKFGTEVPVLFIDERKAFKYRVTASDLTKKLSRKKKPLLGRLARAMGTENSRS
jgi:glutaredoxin